MQFEVFSSRIELIECYKRLLPRDWLLLRLTSFDEAADLLKWIRSWLNSMTIGRTISENELAEGDSRVV